MNFAAYLSYMLLMTFTPGPNNIMAMANAGKYGFIRGLRFNFGVFFGFLIIMISCALFSSFLYGVIPRIEPVMLCAGAAYILWLAWSVWRGGADGGKKRQIQTNSVISGIILQFLNVKLILYGITAMSAFILPHYRGFTALLPFVLLMSFVGFVSTCCWSLSGAVFMSFFSKHKKTANTFMALALVYCAVSQISGLFR